MYKRREWTAIPAGELGQFKGGTGFPIKWQGSASGDYPFYKVSDMNLVGNNEVMGAARNHVSESARNALGATVVPRGAIIFAKVGAAVFLERKRLLSKDSCIDNNLAAFIVDEDRLDPKFAYHSFTHLNLGSFVTTGALPSLNGGQLRSIPIPVPPSMREQIVVAELLDETDAVVSSLKRLIAKKQDVKKGVMQGLLTGRTRLCGFTSEWQYRAFAEMMVGLNTRRSQVDAGLYQSVGAYPVVDQGKKMIAGYSGQECEPIDPGVGGVCIFGDHTTITKFVDFRFVVGADGTKVLRSRCERDFKVRFICYLLEADPVEPTGYNRHFDILRARQFLMPPSEEQQAIVDILRDVDAEIEALEQRLESARAVKTGMMQELLTGRTRLPVKEDA